MNLSPKGTRMLEELAARYSVSVDAVTTLLQAVVNGGGTMAQFNHPDLGGNGQWMLGGMTMVGDMFNHSLKAKVDGLCAELAGFMVTESFFARPAETRGLDGEPAGPAVGIGRGAWWPADLGLPSSTGSQNNTRYAVFPTTHRLAVEFDSQLTIYDTLNHQIGGVGQQQSSNASLSFTSQFGLVRPEELPIVYSHGATPEVPNPVPSAQPTADDNIDIFSKIEHLADLRQRGILSEQEFVSKKSELLSCL
jgi:hypothetical protein